MKKRLLLGCTVLVGLNATGCGAAMSTYLILRAQTEIDGAEVSEAEKYAPYEYTAAQQYLHKAREEQGYADFGPSIEYAFKAQELAEQASSRAEKVKEQQKPPPGAPATAPADEPTPEIVEQPVQSPGAPAESPPGQTQPGPTEPAPNVEIEIVPIAPEQPPSSGGEGGGQGG